MNSILQKFARDWLKEKVKALPDGHQGVFKSMYGRQRKSDSVETAMSKTIDNVVDEMPHDKLDWAMQQVLNSQSKST